MSVQDEDREHRTRQGEEESITATRLSRGHKQSGGFAQKEEKQKEGKNKTKNFLLKTHLRLVISKEVFPKWTMFVRVKTLENMQK